MCEIFGFSSNKKFNIQSELKEFFSHSVNHPDGWGLALGSCNGSINIEKEPCQASTSSYLSHRLQDRIEASLALGHIRYATVGNFTHSNCHPFVAVDKSGRQWTLVHNGTILAFEDLNQFRFTQLGSTDSERVLLFIVNQINKAIEDKAAPLSAAERFEIIEGIVGKLSKNNNKLNILLFDGEILYAHSNYANTLYQNKTDKGIYFCTTPLKEGTWSALPLTQLHGFRNGKLAFKGEVHGNESFQNAETIAAWRKANTDLVTFTEKAA